MAIVFRHRTLPARGYALTLLAVTTAVAAYPRLGAAELDLSLFGGQAWTADSDVQLIRPNGTDLTFADVSWDTNPFSDPPYWGLRLSRSFSELPDWDFAIDFLHAKMYSDPEQLVDVSGLRFSVPIDTTERIRNTFSTLEFTDGHNLLTANALRKWQPFAATGAFSRPTSVYLGGGLGLAVPHSEVDIPGSHTSEYQLAGPAAQFLAGASIPFGKRLSLKTEYRLTWAELDSDLTAGGRLITDSLTHHVNLGVGFEFGGRE